MVKNIVLVLFGAALATLLILGTEDRTLAPDFVEAPLEDAKKDRRVSETELDLYIDVYRTMQSDHSLTIEQALAPRDVTLAEFRDLERRVQKDSSKVERVREALLQHAQDNSRFGEPTPMPAAEDTKDGMPEQP